MDLKYTQISAITKANKCINLCAVIKTIDKITAHQTSKFNMNIKIGLVDASIDFSSKLFYINIFYDTLQPPPKMEPNFILRVLNVQIESVCGTIEGRVFKSSNMIVFNPNNSTNTKDGRPILLMNESGECTISDIIALSELFEWAKSNAWYPKSSGTEILKTFNPTDIKEIDASCSVRINIFCKITKIRRYDCDTFLILTVTDGTICPTHVMKVEGVERQQNIFTMSHFKNCQTEIDLIVLKPGEGFKYLMQDYFIILHNVEVHEVSIGNNRTELLMFFVIKPCVDPFGAFTPYPPHHPSAKHIKKRLDIFRDFKPSSTILSSKSTKRKHVVVNDNRKSLLNSDKNLDGGSVLMATHTQLCHAPDSFENQTLSKNSFPSKDTEICFENNKIVPTNVIRPPNKEMGITSESEIECQATNQNNNLGKTIVASLPKEKEAPTNLQPLSTLNSLKTDLPIYHPTDKGSYSKLLEKIQTTIISKHCKNSDKISANRECEVNSETIKSSSQPSDASNKFKVSSIVQSDLNGKYLDKSLSPRVKRVCLNPSGISEPISSTAKNIEHELQNCLTAQEEIDSSVTTPDFSRTCSYIDAQTREHSTRTLLNSNDRKGGERQNRNLHTKMCCIRRMNLRLIHLCVWIRKIEPSYDNILNIVTALCTNCKLHKVYPLIQNITRMRGQTCRYCSEKGKTTRLQTYFCFNMHVIDRFNQCIVIRVRKNPGEELFGCSVEEFLEDEMLQFNTKCFLTNMTVNMLDDRGKHNMLKCIVLTDCERSKVNLQNVTYKGTYFLTTKKTCVTE